jgi:DNA polymerase III subunit gamma/tau
MLYNSYRPNCLNEVVGHEKVIKALIKRSKENDIPKRILFTGITGVGKTTLMRIIGKNILCNNKDKDGNSCNQCDICKAIDNEQTNSFFLENNASNLNIDEVRKLVQDAEVKSFSQAKAKIFVIDEIQEMKKTPSALNNLLKPLEKDYKNVYFILGTMSLKDVPKAIVNRCTTYDLKPISVDEISKQLYTICNKENIKIDTEEKANVLITVADNSYGSMRTAVSYLERVIDSELWSVKDVIKELDLISNTDIVQSINNLFQAKSEAFNIQYTEELIKKFRYMLGTIYKQLSGIEVPKWQLDQLKGIDKSIKINQVQYTLEKLLELNKYPYINQEIIDYILVDIFNNNKQILLSKKFIEQHTNNCIETLPKRRGE